MIGVMRTHTQEESHVIKAEAGVMQPPAQKGRDCQPPQKLEWLRNDSSLGASEQPGPANT